MSPQYILLVHILSDIFYLVFYVMNVAHNRNVSILVIIHWNVPMVTILNLYQNVAVGKNCDHHYIEYNIV